MWLLRVGGTCFPRPILLLLRDVALSRSQCIRSSVPLPVFWRLAAFGPGRRAGGLLWSVVLAACCFACAPVCFPTRDWLLFVLIRGQRVVALQAKLPLIVRSIGVPLRPLQFNVFCARSAVELRT